MIALQICNAIIGQFFEKLADDAVTLFKLSFLKNWPWALPSHQFFEKLTEGKATASPGTVSTFKGAQAKREL